MAFNPMFGLHVRLMGSWRNQAVVLLVLFGAVSVIANASYRMHEPAEHGNVSTFWLTIVTIASAAFLLLIGPGAIRRAVQRDYDTGMMESHRVSPMSGFKIVLGYLTGPPAQALLLFGANLVVGTYFAAQRGITIGAGVGGVIVAGWYLLEACLLLLAFMLATLVLLTALASSGRTNIMGVVVLISVVVGSWAWQFVPGLALVCGILSGIEFLEPLLRGRAPTAVSGSPFTVLVAALLQLALGVTFVVAACRRVRAPERAMFTLPLALVLLGIWGTALVLGVAFMPRGRGMMMTNFEELPIAQLVCSTVAFMLVALFSIIAAANAAFRQDRATAFGERAPAGGVWVNRFTPLLVALLTTGCALLIFDQLRAFVDNDFEATFSRPETLLAVFLAPLLSLWIDYCLVYACIARGGRVFRTLALWGLVLKVLPLAADMAVGMAHDANDPLVRWKITDGVFTGVSPFGTLLLCCLKDGRPWPGLVVQIGLALGATYLCLRAKERATRVPPRNVAEAAPSA